MSAGADFWRAVRRGVRQGLRSPVFWVYVGLLLYGGIRIARADTSWGEDHVTPERTRLFNFFHEVLAGFLLVLVPYASYLAMARGRGALWALPAEERQRVFLGEVGAHLGRAGLYAFAALPVFVAVCACLMGSPELWRPNLLPLLVLVAVELGFLSVGGASAAVLARGRVGRALIHVSVLCTCLLVLARCLKLFHEDYLRLDLYDDDWESLIVRSSFPLRGTGFSVWWMFSCGCLLFATARSWLLPEAQPRSSEPRRMLIVQVVGSSLLLLCLWPYASPGYGEELMACQLGCFCLSLCGFVLTTAPGAPRTSSTSAFWGPGPVRGLWLAVLLLVFWGAVCGVLDLLSQDVLTVYQDELWMFSDHGPRYCNVPVQVVLVPPLCALLFLSLPLWLGPRSRLGTFALWMSLLILVGVLSPWLAIRLGFSSQDHLFNLLNPFWFLASAPLTFTFWDRAQSWRLVELAGLTTLSVFLAHRALVARERRSLAP